MSATQSCSRAYRPAILLVCSFDPNGILTIRDNIRLWQKFSRFRIDVLNLWSADGRTEIPASVDLADYAGVILHPTVSYHPQYLLALDRKLGRRFTDYDGVKVLVKQDEQFHSRVWAKFIRDNRFDLLLTCVSAEELEKVYPRAVVGDVAVMHTLTGYVTPFLRALVRSPLAARTVDVAYRGSIQPLSFGRLGFEKRKIGAEVAARAGAAGLKYDISSRWEDRILGERWYEFLGCSRVVLGVESGSNLFDFDGEVEKLCEAYAKRNASADPLSDEYYEQAHAAFLHRFEGNVHYAQISPRHFEAAAVGAAQVLYEGAYSGIFKPGVHYAALARDMSNWPEVVDTIRSDTAVRRMTDAAMADVIENPAYHHETFVAAFDCRFAEIAAAKGSMRAPSARCSGRPRVLVLCAHDPVVDPRIEWMASSFAKEAEVCELGCYRWNVIAGGPSMEQVADARMRIRVERTRHGASWLAPIGDDAAWNRPGFREMARLVAYARADRRDLVPIFGEHADDQSLARFRGLCRYFADTNSALVQAALNMGAFDAIIAADLEALPAAVALKAETDAHLVYDSHEYWPHSDVAFRDWESAFWAALEKSLARHADRCVTVSDTLAEHLTAAYGVPFRSIPNAARLADGASALCSAARVPGESETVEFLFQGNFAAGRGLDLIVSAWTGVPANARLHLRGPENPYKAEIVALVNRLDLRDRVFFPDAVAEDALVEAALEADVGIIPYDPRHAGNRFACPNKLSQYMAAGRPIVTNRIEYVARIVRDNGLGFVVDFDDRAKLIETIETCLRERSRLREMGARGRRFFETTFNWEALSSAFVSDVMRAIAPKARAAREPLDFGWITRDRSMWHGREQAPSPPGAALPATMCNAMRKVWHGLPMPVRQHVLRILRRGGVPI